MDSTTPQTGQDLAERIKSVDWYHSIDLGNGIVTPGLYDHRPYLKYYRLPDNVEGKTVLDIGAASGFFSFEFERRGAQVTATELPDWFAHDFGANYRSEHTSETGRVFMNRPFEIAHEALGSRVERKYINVYDISPDTVGMYDIIFCGSMLIHLTDPIKALINMASVTKEKAIINTVVGREEQDRPIAYMIGHYTLDAWWIPTRTCLELMAACAGFKGIEWISEFQMDFRDGTPGHYNGVMHAYTSMENWTENTVHRDEIIERNKGFVPKTAEELEQLNRRQQQSGRRSIERNVGALNRLLAWLRRPFK